MASSKHQRLALVLRELLYFTNDYRVIAPVICGVNATFKPGYGPQVKRVGDVCQDAIRMSSKAVGFLAKLSARSA